MTYSIIHAVLNVNIIHEFNVSEEDDGIKVSKLGRKKKNIKLALNPNCQNSIELHTEHILFQKILTIRTVATQTLHRLTFS